MLRCVTAAGNQHRAPPEWRPVPPATALRNRSVHHPHVRHALSGQRCRDSAHGPRMGLAAAAVGGSECSTTMP